MIKDIPNKQNTLLNDLLEYIEKIPKEPKILNELNKSKDFINEAFAFPPPRLDPIFGEPPHQKISVLSPYGKVRYPLIFSWISNRTICKMIFKINGTELAALESITIVPKSTLFLKENCQYTWESFGIEADGESIVGPVGFFNLCSQEEDLFLLSVMPLISIGGTAPWYSNVLFGSILELKGFYIEAIEKYKNAFGFSRAIEIATRIAFCYDAIGLEDQREKWRQVVITLL